MRTVSIVFLLLVAACAGTSTAPGETAGAKQEVLTAQDVRDLMTGRDLRGTTPFGAAFVSTYRPDGRLVTRTGGRRFEGRWEVLDDGRLCSFWTANQSRRFCDYVYVRDGEVTIYGSGGVTSGALE